MLVSARQLNQLGVVDADLEPPGLVEETTRVLSAAEFSTESGDGAGGQLLPGPRAVSAAR